MSLRTRRGLSMMATLVILVAACSGATPSQAPTNPPTATPVGTVAPTPTGPPPSGSTGPSDCVPFDTTGETEPALEGTNYAPEAVGNTGGTLVLAEWQNIDTLNLYYSQANTNNEAATPAFLSMVDTSKDLKFIPEISTTVPLVSNGGVTDCGNNAMQVEYNIRPGLMWSDNNPITCDDLTAHWHWIMDPAQVGLSGGTVGYEDIDSITNAGNGKCLVHYARQYSGYIGLFSPLLPAAYLATASVADAPTALWPLADVASGVYSGPYKPTSYTAGAQLEYAPNPAYWTAMGKTAPFDSVIFKYYADNPQGEEAGYLTGDYDLGMNFNHTNLPDFFLDPNDPAAGFKPEYSNVLQESTFTYEAWHLNNRRIGGKFGEVNTDSIKTALSMIAPKADVAAIANGGTVEPLGESNNTSPDAWFYKQEPAINTAPGDAELAAAQALLCGASCDPNDPNGGNTGAFYMNDDGFLHLGITDAQLSLDACTTFRPGRLDALKILGDQAKKIGININIDAPYGANPANPNVFGGWASVPNDTPCNTIHGNFDLAEFAFVSPLDPNGGYNVYTCQGIPEDSSAHNGQNVTRTCNADLDAAWNQVKGNVDPAKVTEAMGVVQDYYASHVIEIPLFLWKNVYLVNPRLHNAIGNPTTASVLWNIEDFWMEPAQ